MLSGCARVQYNPKTSENHVSKRSFRVLFHAEQVAKSTFRVLFRPEQVTKRALGVLFRAE